MTQIISSITQQRFVTLVKAFVPSVLFTTQKRSLFRIQLFRWEFVFNKPQIDPMFQISLATI